METFYKEISKLKELERRGWKRCNVEGRIESDAEHTFSMIMLALDIMNHNKTDLDELKVLKLIAYHELCEIDAGDVTPYDNIPPKEKYIKEYECIKRLSKKYDMPEIESYWLEYKELKTPEAKFVKALDKLDAIKQAEIYSLSQNRPDIYQEFYSSSIATIESLKDYKY